MELRPEDCDDAFWAATASLCSVESAKALASHVHEDFHSIAGDVT
jgi:hypothetical protein